jgi:hypothetical protein
MPWGGDDEKRDHGDEADEAEEELDEAVSVLSAPNSLASLID